MSGHSLVQHNSKNKSPETNPPPGNEFWKNAKRSTATLCVWCDRQFFPHFHYRRVFDPYSDPCFFPAGLAVPVGPGPAAHPGDAAFADPYSSPGRPAFSAPAGPVDRVGLADLDYPSACPGSDLRLRQAYVSFQTDSYSC